MYILFQHAEHNVKANLKDLAWISVTIWILTFLKLQELSCTSRFSILQILNLISLYSFLFYKEKDLCFAIFEDSSIVKRQNLDILFTVYQLLQALIMGDASAWARQKYWILAQVFPQRILISYGTSNVFGGTGNLTTLSINPTKFIMRFKHFLTVKLKHEPRNNKLHSEISARKHTGEKKDTKYDFQTINNIFAVMLASLFLKPI